MEQNNYNIPLRILQIIEKNLPYKELAIEEQLAIIESIGEDSFEIYRKSINSTKNLLIEQAKNITAHDSTRYVLQYAIEQKRKESQPKIQKVFNRKISVLNMAALIAIIVIGVGIFGLLKRR